MPSVIAYLSDGDAASRATLARTITDAVVAATGADPAKVQTYFQASNTTTTSIELHAVGSPDLDPGAVEKHIREALGGTDVAAILYAPGHTARGGRLRQAPADSEETQ